LANNFQISERNLTRQPTVNCRKRRFFQRF